MKSKYSAALTVSAVIFAALTIIFLTSNATLKIQAAGGTISGRVFQDYNDDGIYDTTTGFAVDSGVGAVTVKIYDASGVLKGTTTTAATTGLYSIATPDNTVPYRVEFTALPTGFQPSAHSTDSAAARAATTAGSAVQFVPAGNTVNVNLAVNRPVEYCQDNPLICIPQATLGDVEGDSLKSFPYSYSNDLDGNINSTSITNSPTRDATLAPTAIGQNNSIGTTFGVSYNNLTKILYASAYVKRDAKLGALSSNSTGAIYAKSNPAATTPAPTVYVDLNAVFGAGTTGANPHPAIGSASWTGTTPDTGTTTTVGKIGLGGLKLSQDGSILYTVNLANRELYLIPTSGTLSNSTILHYAIPTANLATASGTNCLAADVRPFGLGRDVNGSIYVGAVCSGETAAVSTVLQAYVWRFDTGGVFTLAATNGLTFGRVAGTNESAAWNYWANTSNVLNRAAPMLTDIEFDRGSMILGFRDRYGDQSDQAANPNYYRGYGDLMRACPSGGSWIFESNGACGGITTTGAGTNAGNGGGEFYVDLNGDNREEGVSGGLYQIPGFNSVLATAYDPVTYLSSGTRYSNFYTAGVQRYNNTTGAMSGAYDVYLRDDSNTFGKANGVGDIEALCDKAPIEIGNRVWRDSNGNGVQDPGESGIAGITVRLYNSANVLIAAAVTDANGEYYFSSAAGTNAGNNIYGLNLLPNTSYSIRIDNPANYGSGNSLAGLTLTSAKKSTQAGFTDGSDSDGYNTVNPTGSPSGVFPVINLTTGASGANNHNYDFGFTPGTTAAPVSVSGRALDANWRGLPRVAMTLTTQSGKTMTAMTNQFGYFTFSDVGGQSAVVTAAAKGRTFTQSSQYVGLTENVDNLYFIANQ